MADEKDLSFTLRFPVRAYELDSLGHVNNAVYWQAVEELLPGLEIDPRRPLRAELDYRRPIDLGEAIELAPFGDGGVAFVANGSDVRAVAQVGR